MASEISCARIHQVGEDFAEDNSDQVVVTTLADLFDVKRAVSRGHSAQLVATLTPENFETVVESRYSRRFAALPDRSSHTRGDGTTSSTVLNAQNGRRPTPSGMGEDVQSLGPEARRDRPNSNEMKKRLANDDHGQKDTLHTE